MKKSKATKAAPAEETVLKKPLLSTEEFVLLAIQKLGNGKSLHTVYSHFNSSFREYYKELGLDPIVEVQKLVEQGKISFRFARGGAMIGLPGLFESKDDPLKLMGLK